VLMLVILALCHVCQKSLNILATINFQKNWILLTLFSFECNYSCKYEATLSLNQHWLFLFLYLWFVGFNKRNKTNKHSLFQYCSKHLLNELIQDSWTKTIVGKVEATENGPVNDTLGSYNEVLFGKWKIKSQLKEKWTVNVKTVCIFFRGRPKYDYYINIMNYEFKCNWTKPLFVCAED